MHIYKAALFACAVIAAAATMKMKPSCHKLCNTNGRVSKSKLEECNCLDVLSQNKGVFYDYTREGMKNNNFLQQFLNPSLESNSLLQFYGKDINSEDRDKKRIKKYKNPQVIATGKPIYIDIEINKLGSTESLKNDDKDVTSYQGDIEECLDIYAVLHSRRSNNIPKLEEKWGSEKLERYIYLSNAELIKESLIKCAQPTYIIKQSLDEIKQSVPTSSGNSKLVKDNFNYVYEKSKVVTDANHKNNLITEEVDSLSTQTPLYSDNESTTNNPSNDVSYVSDSVNEIESSSHTKSEEDYENVTEAGPPQQVTDTEIKGHYYTTESSPPVLTTEMYNNVVETEECETCYTNNQYTLSAESRATEIVGQDTLLPYDTSKSTPPPNYGYEVTESSVVVDEITTEVIIDPTRDNKASKLSEPKWEEKQAVTGSIYFNFNNQNIPARFIQDQSGRINISIDTIALCEKIDTSSNGSILIGIMCKCVQSKTCS